MLEMKIAVSTNVVAVLKKIVLKTICLKRNQNE